MANFWQGLGQHFVDMGNGIVSIVQGAGATLNANAAFTQSSAALQTAQAQNYAATLAMQAEQQKQENKKSMLLILLIFGVPTLLIVALLIFKSRGA